MTSRIEKLKETVERYMKYYGKSATIRYIETTLSENFNLSNAEQRSLKRNL